MSLNIDKGANKRVVIVGGGFAGMQVALGLSGSKMQVVLIDKNNYHQFPPLIYQVASAGMEPTSISFPFRRMFRRSDNIFFRLAEVLSIDAERKVVTTSIGEVDYDYLVLAMGSTTNYYGNANVEAEALPMKTVTEAMALRNTILTNIERAITTSDAVKRQELLNIVVVGGGATGVEVAGVLSEMKRMVLPREYRDLDSSLVNIYLIEAGNRLLSGLSPQSSEAALQFLRSMGVNVLLNKAVTDYKDHKVALSDGSAIATRTFIWVSGVAGCHVSGLPEELLGRGRRIKVDACNRVEGMDGVFCIGDQCLSTADRRYANGHPQLAQVAMQQGRNLARNIKAAERGRKLRPFSYRNYGAMATIGRNKAVCEIGHFKTAGFTAWVMWLVVHLRSILGVRNKVVVMLNWVWNYFNYNQSLRLILNVASRKAAGKE